ncbi:MAG: SulP family inorganic anion transporter [Rhodobacteraceae bacterium]|nr:SulP family inorganic anion transporter [Paracoccaceae bacterium]
MRQPKILTTMRGYSLSLFLADLLAGLTVALVALPLSLAIAIASGADPARGLVTAIVGGFFISLLGGSRVQIGGPTGAFIVVVYSVIADHGYDGLILATFMAGVILLMAGYFRLGRLVAYVPGAVVNGFTIGIAIVIATSQIKDFLGLQMGNVPAEFISKVQALAGAADSASLSALLVAMVTLVLIVAFRRLAPRWPGLIVAIIAGSALAWALGGSVDTLHSRFGDLPANLPMPMLPQPTFAKVVELLPSAFVIAFLAGIESLLSAVVADRMIEGHHRPNAEVTAQGVANIASAMFGGMPATGAIARTATNIRAGGKTPVAGLVHALAIWLMMAAFAPLVGQLALPALAALLVMVAWNMSEPHKWRSYLAERRSDQVLLVLTLVLTVVVDLTIAIGTGVALGLALRIERNRLRPGRWTGLSREDMHSDQDEKQP